MTDFDATVIIPTYNRLTFLLEALDSLGRQRLTGYLFEVVVVDDGSTDGTERIKHMSFPFAFCYLRQSNRGSAGARNAGAERAKGKILIFLDDDMLVEPSFIAGLVSEHQGYDRIIGMATELRYEPPVSSPYAHMSAQGVAGRSARQSGDFVQFTDCVTNNLSVESDAFFEIGMMQDVAGDGPTWWGDIDFGYRAYKLGFRFRRSAQAKCIHRDYSLHSLSSTSGRYFKASQMAVLLIQKHPSVLPFLPMFRDKLSIAWRRDDGSLIIRKLLRQVASNRLVVAGMEQAAANLERYHPSSGALPLFYRLIVGAYIYRGFRDGLKKYGPLSMLSEYQTEFSTL